MNERMITEGRTASEYDEGFVSIVFIGVGGGEEMELFALTLRRYDAGDAARRLCGQRLRAP